MQEILEWRAPTQYRHYNRVSFLVYAVSMLRLASHYTAALEKNLGVHGLGHGGTTMLHAVTIILTAEFICPI